MASNTGFHGDGTEPSNSIITGNILKRWTSLDCLEGGLGVIFRISKIYATLDKIVDYKAAYITFVTGLHSMGV